LKTKPKIPLCLQLPLLLLVPLLQLSQGCLLLQLKRKKVPQLALESWQLQWHL
jgi:hypothetical protein